MPTEELYGSYHFLLEIQGVISDNKIIVGGFKSVSGMDSETEIIEFKQGNDLIVRKNSEDVKIDRRAGAVIILDQDGQTEVARYNFFEGWPCKWEAPNMDSDSSSMAIEKIELAIEKVERA